MRRTFVQTARASIRATLIGGLLAAAGGAVYGLLWGALVGVLHGEPAKTLWCGLYFAALVAVSGALVGGLAGLLLGAEEGDEDLAPPGQQGHRPQRSRNPAEKDPVAPERGPVPQANGQASYPSRAGN